MASGVRANRSNVQQHQDTPPNQFQKQTLGKRKVSANRRDESTEEKADAAFSAKFCSAPRPVSPPLLNLSELSDSLPDASTPDKMKRRRFPSLSDLAAALPEATETASSSTSSSFSSIFLDTGSGSSTASASSSSGPLQKVETDEIEVSMDKLTVNDVLPRSYRSAPLHSFFPFLLMPPPERGDQRPLPNLPDEDPLREQQHSSSPEKEISSSSVDMEDTDLPPLPPTPPNEQDGSLHSDFYD